MSLKKWKVAVGNAAVMWAVIARVMVGHVVDGAAFREVVMDAETLGATSIIASVWSNTFSNGER